MHADHWCRVLPEDRSCLIVDRLSALIHMFTITFHIALLEVGRKTMEVLIIGQDCFCMPAKEIIIPYSDQAKDDRNVFIKGGC